MHHNVATVMTIRMNESDAKKFLSEVRAGENFAESGLEQLRRCPTKIWDSQRSIITAACARAIRK